MFCANCGNEQPANFNYCSACGARLTPPMPEQSTALSQNEVTSTANASVRKRPKRLLVMSIWNMTSALLALSGVIAIWGRPVITSRLGWDSGDLMFGAALATFLLGASLLALLGKKNGHLVMLAAVTIFFGQLIYQNADLIGHAEVVFKEGGEGKVIANIVRSGLQLTLTAWAALSMKTRLYFKPRHAAPGA